MFNKAWFDKLPKDLQTLLLSARLPLNGEPSETEKGRTAVRELTPKLIKKLEEKKITVYKMSDAEKGVFKEKTKKVHDEFRKKVGGKGTKMLDIINKNK
jgi:TRAP-type C4-dicarboxylate transport system substrate-binding protein